MALLTAVSVTSGATNVPALAAGTSNTVSGGDIGARGALLQVVNGSGGSITVTISDPGTTAVGNAGTTTPQSVGAGTDRWFRLVPGHVDPSSQVATVTLSSATSVTYRLIRGA